MKTKEKSMLANIADLLREANKKLENINKSENSRTEKEFKNEDFHIKVWETDDEIGAETIFVRGCFSYSSKKLLNNWSMAIEPFLRTQIYYNSLPNFGMDTTIHISKKSGIRGYTFKDIVEELETAHNESLKAHSKELTIEDVIKEIKSVDTVTEKWNILGNYEFNLSGNFGDWHSLQNNESILNSTFAYELGLFKLRRKEVKQ